MATLAVGTASFAVITAIAVVSIVPWPGHEDTWQLSATGGVNGVAFFPGQRLLVSASGGASQNSQDTVWDIANRARPVRLSAFQGGEPTAMSPDGRTLSTVTYGGQLALWTVSDPAGPGRPTRAAVLAAPRDFTQAIAFSPRGDLLAGVTYHGTVLMYDLADPAHPVRAATIGGIVARAFFPDGRLTAAGPVCAICSPASYAVAFAPDGRTLTVVVDRAENDPALDNAARDTVFTWTVTGSGALGALATAARNVEDNQPALAPDGHTVVDGSPTSGTVYLWNATGTPVTSPPSEPRSH